MNVIAAALAGLVGTLVMTALMRLAPQMGLPRMDIVGMLGSMFNGQGNRSLGMIAHLMMGIVFAIVYALLWSAGVGSVGLLGGLLFGVGHWLVVGLVMGGMPVMHAGIRAGNVPAPGLYMTASGGLMSFLGGLMGHVAFGVVVALVYGLFV